MTKQKTATRTEAEETAAAVLRFWTAGRESWGRIDPDVPTKRGKARPSVDTDYRYGNKLDLLHAEADRLGMNHDTLTKAWKVGREYTREQIDTLHELVVEHGARFGPTHLTRLLAVVDRKRRDALTRAAIRGRWGVIRLERMIQVENRCRRPLVGRKPVIPDTEPELLAALDALSDKWSRWCAAAEEQIPEDLADVLNRATAAVARVKSAVATKLSKSK